MATLHRRELLRAFGYCAAGLSASGWMPGLALALANNPNRKRHCVLLWMTGGPTQTDTFDMKPGHANGGEFKPIETSAPGLMICEHLPKLARLGEHLAVIRSLSTKEGDHGRGTYLMRTGHPPQGSISYPTIGSSLSKALGSEDADLPNYVAIAPYSAFNRAAFSPGFLGPRYAALTVGATEVFQQPPQPPQTGYAELGVDDLKNPSVDRAQEDARFALWRTLQTSFLSHHQSAAPKAHDTVYQRAVRMMRSQAANAFDLAQEPDSVRDAYGRGRFGQGCLMARRLIERGVPFIEVSLGGNNGGAFAWDTHAQNFPTVKNLCAELDAGWATLMSDLKDRGLLDSTTILWLGEFGRTPKINQNAGRDHFPNAWTCVLAGGGIRGGQAYGKTNDSGEEVADAKVDVGDVLATLCRALGVDPDATNISDLGRPIKIAEGKPIEAVLA
jgi:hypothetical protein